MERADGEGKKGRVQTGVLKLTAVYAVLAHVSGTHVLSKVYLLRIEGSIPQSDRRCWSGGGQLPARGGGH